MYTYRNAFHNTRARCTIGPQQFEDSAEVQQIPYTRCDRYELKIKKAATQLRKQLCGVKGCQCSGWLGTR